MNLGEVKSSILEEAYSLLPAKMESDKATLMLLAIGMQESRFLTRKQINGPARSYWQFEVGGVSGVLRHKASKQAALAVCDARGVRPVAEEVHAALEFDDVLGACFARLLLYTDPKPLPDIGEADEAWEFYLRTWRPGKPHRHTWGGLYLAAMGEVLP